MTESTHMDTPRPLSILKQLPPMSPGSTPLKRPPGASLDKSPKRARIVTPDFKMPALPARALTPSTSTVAFSSSPQRLEPSSPPTSVPKHVKILDIAMDPVQLESGTAIIFGRHRHSHSSDRSTSLHSAVPSHLRHLVADLDAPARIVYLPRSARHASRVHVVAEYMEDSDLIRITVIGQNGLRLEGRRILPGQRFDLRRRDELELSFYGASVVLEFPGEPRERLFTPDESSEVDYEAPTPESSLPPSSPPERRASTPLSAHESPAPAIPEIAEVKDDEKPRQSTSPKIGDPEVDTALALPTGIDLPALLASTVVFSGSSKLSLPDLVKHMLESQPSLRTHGSEAQWEFWCASALDANAMFGKVQRHGKDSSGRPLLPHYFYNPDLDTDLSRAKELGGLVRPLRTVQRGGGKAIDWRPVGGGRRRY